MKWQATLSSFKIANDFDVIFDSNCDSLDPAASYFDYSLNRH